MIRYQEGMVLLTTIQLIVLLGLLIFSLMNAVFLYIKVSHQMVRTHDTLYQLETIAAQLSVGMEVNACVSTGEDINQIATLLRAHKGCSLLDHKTNYQYWIDDLGLYPCLTIVSGKSTYSSHHWLISVANLAPHASILQLRVAVKSRRVGCDSSDKQLIHPGTLSWRYLPSG